MSTGGRQLKRLHQLHLQLRDVTDAIAKGPRQIKARQAIVEKRIGELEAAKQALKQLKMASDQKNLQLKTQESKIADHNAKLNAASTNREYDILRGQIAADTMSKSVLEDEILETLDGIDVGGRDIVEREKAVETAKADVVALEKQVQAESAGLQAKLAELTGQLREVEKVLPPDVVPVYQRLVQKHGADALAAVENRSCTACYLSLTPQMMVELSSGKPLFCKSCARLLYQTEESKASV